MPRLLNRAVAVALVFALVGAGCGSDRAETKPTGSVPAHDTTGDSAARILDARMDRVTFHDDMRRLWEDHITWTRLYIVSAAAGLPDLDATANRLLQNQDDLGRAVASFYGGTVGDQLAGLLRQHILIAADLVTAAKSGDTAQVSADSDRWYSHADEIAGFLAAANPAWPEATLRTMMHTHLDQTLAEATARLHGDWAADIAAYDHIHLHILEMADTLADGIVEQFPDRFTA